MRAALLSALFLASCTSSEPGVLVALRVSPAPIVDEARLDRAVIAVAAIELLPCTPLDGGLSFEALFVSRARAHSRSTPTRSGEPYVVSLLEGTVDVGMLAPPASSYCRVRVELGPADRDAVHGEALGLYARTLEMEGAVQRDGAWLSFSAWAGASRTIDLTLGEPLVLDEATDRPSLEITLDTAETLRSMDPHASPKELGYALLGGLSLEARANLR